MKSSLFFFFFQLHGITLCTVYCKNMIPSSIEGGKLILPICLYSHATLTSNCKNTLVSYPLIDCHCFCRQLQGVCFFLFLYCYNIISKLKEIKNSQLICSNEQTHLGYTSIQQGNARLERQSHS